MFKHVLFCSEKLFFCGLNMFQVAETYWNDLTFLMPRDRRCWCFRHRFRHRWDRLNCLDCLARKNDPGGNMMLRMKHRMKHMIKWNKKNRNATCHLDLHRRGRSNGSWRLVATGLNMGQKCCSTRFTSLFIDQRIPKVMKKKIKVNDSLIRDESFPYDAFMIHGAWLFDNKHVFKCWLSRGLPLEVFPTAPCLAFIFRKKVMALDLRILDDWLWEISWCYIMRPRRCQKQIISVNTSFIATKTHVTWLEPWIRKKKLAVLWRCP